MSNDYDFLDADPATKTRVVHETALLARGHVRLMNDEMSEAIAITRTIAEKIKHIYNLSSIEQSMAFDLNDQHNKKSALLNRIKERACLLAVNIALDQDFKVVKAGE